MSPRRARGEDEGVTLARRAAALELGADVDAANDDGDTALHMASALP